MRAPLPSRVLLKVSLLAVATAVPVAAALSGAGSPVGAAAADAGVSAGVRAGAAPAGHGADQAFEGPHQDDAQAAGPKPSELVLDASLIEELLRVIYFGDDGRYHFREYSACNYEFLQDAAVSIEDGLIRVSGHYYQRRGREAFGRCVGSPSLDTSVTMTARPSAAGSGVALEVLEVSTETLPELSSAILGLLGVEVPMTHTFDLMAALNGMLYGQQPFGIAALEIHDVALRDGAARLRLTLRMGIW